MNHPHRIATGVVLAAAVLTGCANPGYNPLPISQAAPVQTYPAAAPAYATTGTIDSVQLLQQGSPGNTGIGAGTLIGGIVGGMLGNRVGAGKGRKAATIAGVVGGAMIGHEVDRNARTGSAYQVGVRMDNGGYRTLVQDNVADLPVGARVRVENDRVYRY